MHAAARIAGKQFFDTYATDSCKRVLDVGSLDVNGTLRDLSPKGAEYTGVDRSAGRGVDLVLADPYQLPFPDGHFDLIVSSSCFEHDELFWLTFQEMCRVLAKDGVIYINVPACGPYHAYPRDCWRFYPDAALALVAWSERTGNPVRLAESFHVARSFTEFRDHVSVFTKRERRDDDAFMCDKLRDIGWLRKNDGPLTMAHTKF